MTAKYLIFYFLPSRTGRISIQLFSIYHVYIVITVAVNIHRYMLILILTNEPIFNSEHHLHWPYTIAIREQWLTPDVSNCMIFNFNSRMYVWSANLVLNLNLKT